MLARHFLKSLPAFERSLHAQFPTAVSGSRLCSTQAALHDEDGPDLSYTDEDSPYRLANTTPATAVIVKALAETKEPLTTTELWEKVKDSEFFASKRRMKNALKQLRAHKYLTAVPNRGMKRGDMKDAFLLTLTMKVKLPEDSVGGVAQDFEASTSKEANKPLSWDD